MADKAQLTQASPRASRQGQSKAAHSTAASVSPKQKTTGRQLRDFYGDEKTPETWETTNGYKPHNYFIPAQYFINTDEGIKEIVYSEGTSSIFKDELGDKVRKTQIPARNGLLKVDGTNALLKWYLYEITINGNPRFNGVARKDFEREAEVALQTDELIFENYAAIKEMSVPRLRAMCFGIGKPAVANEPTKALQARLQAYNKQNPQGFYNLMQDENVDVMYYCSQGITTGLVTVDGPSILVKGTPVCGVQPASSPVNTLARYLEDNKSAREAWLGILKENAGA